MQRAVGPLVTSECNIFALSVKDPHELPADIRDGSDGLQGRVPHAQHADRNAPSRSYSGYCAEFKPEHAPLVTDKMIKETTLTGSAEEIQVRIRKMAAAGVNQVTIAGDRRP